MRNAAEGAAAAPSAARIVATVFLPFAAGYFLSYAFRGVNAVIADDLTEATGLGPAALGALTSAYLVAFAAAQLPLGVLLDRFGARRVQTVLLLVAAAGSFVFALGTGLADLSAGRALIGFGVSGCLMAAIKANTSFWPRERLPFVNGAFLAAGGLGAVFATAPAAALLDVIGWRGLFHALAVLCVGVAALVHFVVPDPPDAGGPPTPLARQVREAAGVFADPLFRRVAPACALAQGAWLAYAGLWAGPWLRDVDGLPRDAAAWQLQAMAIAMVLSYLTLGWAAERLDRLGVRPAASCGAAIAVAVAAQAALAAGLPPGASAVAWVVVGFACSGSVLGYAVLTQHFPPSMAGRASTSLNVLMFGSAFLLQAGIGWAVEAYPQPAPGAYAAEGHRLALAAVAGLQALGLAWMAWPRRPAGAAAR